MLALSRKCVCSGNGTVWLCCWLSSGGGRRGLWWANRRTDGWMDGWMDMHCSEANSSTVFMHNQTASCFSTNLLATQAWGGGKAFCDRFLFILCGTACWLSCRQVNFVVSVYLCRLRRGCNSWADLVDSTLQSAWLLLFQVPARLSGTSATGMAPVVNSWSGRGRKPVTAPSRPAITQQIQVIESADWTSFDAVHARSDKSSSSASDSALLSYFLSFPGYYMRVNFSQGSTQSDARLQSPQLPPSSPYCQIL